MFSKFVLASVAAAALLAASVRAEDPSLVTKNGDLHISVGDTKGKVYVKSADGTTIELFDLAARLKAIETAIPDIKGEIEGNTKDIETKFTALDGTLNGVKSIVDQNVKANADKIKTLDDNAKKSADAMKALPEMISCAVNGKIYHTKEDECQAAKAAHCVRISNSLDTKAPGSIDTIVKGGMAVEEMLCAFNRHYGGTACKAGCRPGNKITLKSKAAATVTCNGESKWDANFECKIVSCPKVPQHKAAKDLVRVVNNKGSNGDGVSFGAEYEIKCTAASSVLGGKVTKLKCIQGSGDTLKWSSPAWDATCSNRYPWKELNGKFVGLTKDKKPESYKWWANSCNRNNNLYGDGCSMTSKTLWGTPYFVGPYCASGEAKVKHNTNLPNMNDKIKKVHAFFSGGRGGGGYLQLQWTYTNGRTEKSNNGYYQHDCYNRCQVGNGCVYVGRHGHGCCDVSYRTYWNNPKPNDEVKYVRFQQQRGYVDMWGLTYERP